MRNALQRDYEQTAPAEETTKVHLKEVEVVYFDKTGIWIDGKLHWLHTASTNDSIYLFIHEQRGCKALTSEQLMLKNFNGIAGMRLFGGLFQIRCSTPRSVWRRTSAPGVK